MFLLPDDVLEVMWNSKIQNPFTESIDFQLEIAKESKLVAGDVASINLPSQFLINLHQGMIFVTSKVSVSITNDSGFLIDHSVTILDTSVENEINGMESKGPSEDEIPNFVSSTLSGSRNVMPQDLYFSDIDDSNSDNETIYNIHLPSMELVAPKIAGPFICGCKRPFITKLMYQLHSEKCIKVIFLLMLIPFNCHPFDILTIKTFLSHNRTFMSHAVLNQILKLHYHPQSWTKILRERQFFPHFPNMDKSVKQSMHCSRQAAKSLLLYTHRPDRQR
ncbi:uncharacterized protein LOC130630122 [Hydractinia symbiolongicarpus]|uniref:uncharacterized protein LOC130630122 n=1 Tax=Hydractinia symbiolongicarpus TaxID=13093 RepID=UPI00254FC1E2|nr:uncharacterized protein LOC130630122 [Hydractinia symbiolongicarpus]